MTRASRADGACASRADGAPASQADGAHAAQADGARESPAYGAPAAQTDGARHAEWLALASASPGRAIPQLEQEWEGARLAGRTRDRIAAARALGLAERGRMRLDASLGHLEEALRLSEGLGDRTLAAHCANTYAATLMYAGRAAEALALMDRVVDDLPPEDRPQALTQRVALLSIAGRQLEALRASDAVLASFADPELAVWEARVRQTRSMAYLYLGDPPAGIEEANAAIAIYQRLGNEAGVARTRHNVAALRGIGGDVLGALDEFRQVEAEFRRLDIPLALGADGRVATLLAAGLAEDAVLEAGTAARAFAAQGAQGFLVDATLWQALALAHLGRWAEVADSASTARRAFAAQARPQWEAFADALEVEGRMGGFDGAVRACYDSRVATQVEPWARRAVLAASGMRAHRWSQATRAEVLAAVVAASIGDTADVARLGALGELRHADLTEHQLLGWLAAGAAASLRRRNQEGLREAAAFWRDGVNAAHRLDQAFATVDGRLLIIAMGTCLSAAGKAALLRAGRPDETLAWVEGERATLSLTRLAPGEDDTEERLLAELRAVRLQAAGPASDATDDGDVSRRSRQADIERALRDRAIQAIRNQPGRPARAPTRRERGGLGVSVVIDHDTVHALVEHRDGTVRHHEIGPLSHVRLVSRRLRRSAERLSVDADQWTIVAESIEEDLAALDDLLVAPWAGALDPTGVRISVPPDLEVPWCALPRLTAGPVALVSSLREPGLPGARPQDASEVVAVAGPCLPYAELEVAGIAAVRPVRVLSGAAATGAGVLAALARATTLHLACHATFRLDQPLFSTLELADGPLFLHDLARVANVPEVVVVSACNAGRGTGRAGGGSAGFAHTLRRHGAQVVVAPQVPVNDELVAAPMVRLHVRLHAGEDPVAAMAAVRIDSTLSAPERFTASTLTTFGAHRTRPRGGPGHGP